MSFLAWIVVGFIAGWLAGQVMKGGWLCWDSGTAEAWSDRLLSRSSAQ